MATSPTENFQATIEAFSHLLETAPNFFSSIRSIYFEQCSCHMSCLNNHEFMKYLEEKHSRKASRFSPRQPTAELAYFLLCLQRLTPLELIQFIQFELIQKGPTSLKSLASERCGLLFQAELPNNQFKLYTFLFSLVLKFGYVRELADLLSHWYSWFAENFNEEQNYLVKLSKRASHVSFIVLSSFTSSPLVHVIEDSFFLVNDKHEYLLKRNLSHYSVTKFYKCGEQIIEDLSSFWSSKETYPFKTFETIFPLSHIDFLNLSQHRKSPEKTQEFIDPLLSPEEPISAEVKALLIRNNFVSLLDHKLTNGEPLLEKIIICPSWQNLYDFVHYCKVECLNYCKLHHVSFFVKNNDHSAYFFQLIKRVKDPFLTFWYFSLPVSQRLPGLFDHSYSLVLIPCFTQEHSKLRYSALKKLLGEHDKNKFKKVLELAIHLNQIFEFLIYFKTPGTPPPFVFTTDWANWVDYYCTNSQKIKLLLNNLYISKQRLKKRNNYSTKTNILKLICKNEQHKQNKTLTSALQKLSIKNE